MLSPTPLTTDSFSAPFAPSADNPIPPSSADPHPIETPSSPIPSSLGAILRQPQAWVSTPASPPQQTFGLLLIAALSVATWGAALHLPFGPSAMIHGALAAAGACALAWLSSLPTLLILGSILGSRLPFSLVLRASVVTVTFAGLALLASVPVLWYFELAAPQLLLPIAMMTLAGVGASMLEIFSRIMTNLEGTRLWNRLWLLLLAAIGAELFFAFGLFSQISPA
jgi:hypothetical protein